MDIKIKFTEFGKGVAIGLDRRYRWRDSVRYSYVRDRRIKCQTIQ